MKKSMKSIQAFTKMQVITKASQKQLKGGVHLIKMCDIGVGPM